MKFRDFLASAVQLIFGTVLTIPLSALGDPVGDNRYKVTLLRNGETREREVSIGARNDTDVEIVKGLEAGDEVVTGEGKPGVAQ